MPDHVLRDVIKAILRFVLDASLRKAQRIDSSAMDHATRSAVFNPAPSWLARLATLSTNRTA
jgi:hypothetical protein